MRLFWNIFENEDFRYFWLGFLKIPLAFYWDKLTNKIKVFKLETLIE